MIIKSFVALLGFLAACSPHNSQMLPGLTPPAWGTPEWHAFVNRLADSLQAADPRCDAEEAAKRGDFHVLGLLGYDLQVPGLDHWSKYKPGVYILPATSDAMEGLDHVAYMLVAHQYASEYNQTILAKRSEVR